MKERGFFKKVNDRLQESLTEVLKEHGIEKIDDDLIISQIENIPYTFTYNDKLAITVNSLVLITGKHWQMEIIKHFGKGSETVKIKI